MPAAARPHPVTAVMTCRPSRALMGALAAVLILAPLSLAAPAQSQAAQSQAVAARPDARPNIVLITTDDQTLYDMQWMPRTNKALGGGGTTFTHALSPHPQCCPARAELLTGQYGQNNGVLNNNGDAGGFLALQDPGNTVATWLQRSGYETAQVGKYMNSYSGEHGAQEGWTHWDASIEDVYSFFGTTTYADGSPVQHPENIADVVRATTLRWIKQFHEADAPFFIWASQLAPHTALPVGSTTWTDPLPAERHTGVLTDVKAPSRSHPSYNQVAADQPTYWAPKNKVVSDRQIQRSFTRRIQSLQSVDEMVAAVKRTLKRTGELENTVIMFTSDNGYLLGEHQLVGKNNVYQQALRVPLLVRGPGVAAGRRLSQPVTLTDIAPTIADYAGVRPGRLVDGQSFRPLLEGRSTAWRTTQLIQTGTADMSGPQPGWEYRGVMTGRYTYAFNPATGGAVLYDRKADPAELANVVADQRYGRVAAELHRRAVALSDCAGASCWTDFGKVGKPLPRT